MVSELIIKEEACWNEQLVQELFDPEISNEILATGLGSLELEDRMVWTPCKSGSFTVKSAYNSSREETINQISEKASSSYQTPKSLWKKIWQSHTYPKIKYFLWSDCQNALATKDNLFRRQILPHPLCSLCNQCPETVEHALLLCSWTRKISASFELLAFVLWQIWKARNHFVFREKKPDPQQVVDEAVAMQRNHDRWLPPKKKTKNAASFHLHQWRPPEPGELKINIDGG